MAEKNKKTGTRLNLDTPSIVKDLQASVNIPDSGQLTCKLISLPLYLAGNLGDMGIEQG